MWEPFPWGSEWGSPAWPGSFFYRRPFMSESAAAHTTGSLRK